MLDFNFEQIYKKNYKKYVFIRKNTYFYTFKMQDTLF